MADNEFQEALEDEFSVMELEDRFEFTVLGMPTDEVEDNTGCDNDGCTVNDNCGKGIA